MVLGMVQFAPAAIGLLKKILSVNTSVHQTFPAENLRWIEAESPVRVL